MSLNTLLSPNELNLYSESVTADRLNITRDINITGADGDVLYIEGNELKKLPIGANGKVLKVSASLPSWQTDDTTETASELKTSGSNVVIGTSAPPTVGQILKADNPPTSASWQDDNGGGSLQDAYNLGATINLDDVNNNISIDATNYTGGDGALYIVNTANNALVRADLTNNAHVIATKNNIYHDPDDNSRLIKIGFDGVDVDVSHNSSGGNYAYTRGGGTNGTFTFKNQTGDVIVDGSNILIQPSSGTVDIKGTTATGEKALIIKDSANQERATITDTGVGKFRALEGDADGVTPTLSISGVGPSPLIIGGPDVTFEMGDGASPGQVYYSNASSKVAMLDKPVADGKFLSMGTAGVPTWEDAGVPDPLLVTGTNYVDKLRVQNVIGEATFQVDTVNNKISELQKTITFTDSIDNTVQTDFPSVVGPSPQPYQWFLFVVSGLLPPLLVVKSNASLSYTSASTFLTEINTFYATELTPYPGASVIFDYNTTTKLFSFTMDKGTHSLLAIGMTQNLGDSIDINTTGALLLSGSTAYAWLNQSLTEPIIFAPGNSPWRNESVVNQYNKEYDTGDFVLSTDQTAMILKTNLWGTGIIIDNKITFDNAGVLVSNNENGGLIVSGSTTGVDNLVIDTSNSKIIMEADETVLRTSKEFTKTFLTISDDNTDGMLFDFLNQFSGGKTTLFVDSDGAFSITTPTDLNLSSTSTTRLSSNGTLQFTNSGGSFDWPSVGPTQVGSALVYDGTPVLKWSPGTMQGVYNASPTKEINMDSTGLVLKNTGVPVTVDELFRIDTDTDTVFRVACGPILSTVEVKGGNTTDKFTVKTTSNNALFQVDTINNSVIVKSPIAPSANAFYVEEPTFIKVFNVDTNGLGTTTIQGNAIMNAITSVRGQNNNNKFYVENSGGTNKIINIKTNTEGSAPGTVAFDANTFNGSGGYNIIRGDNNQAFAVERGDTITVMNIDTLSNGGEIAIRRLYPTTGSSIGAGSMYYAHTDANNTLRNLAIGSTNDVLRVQAGIPTWVSPLKQNFQYFTNPLSGTLPSASTTCTLAWTTPNYIAYPINYTSFVWSASSFKSADWTLNANNSLTYTNATTKKFRINYSLCIVPGSNDRDFRIGVSKINATYPSTIIMSSATDFIQQSLTCFTLKDGTPNQGSVDNSFIADIAQNNVLQIVVGCVQSGQLFNISGINLTVEEVKDLA